MTALLITQCLQQDFVAPIGRYEPLPNRLHIGHAEALRLIGEDPATGPVARMMAWAYAQPDETLKLVHIRDWHEATDPQQMAHLGHFGAHCLQNTPGAAFAFPEPEQHGKHVAVVNTLTLNDFHGTTLVESLAPWADQPLHVGLIGVWTEAKITFLAYELSSRYPKWSLAVCSALTASSSRAQHFLALDQLQKLFGVHIFDTPAELMAFLGNAEAQTPLLSATAEHPQLTFSGESLTPEDQALVRHLFRECREVSLRRLDGGFSGNVVLGTESTDLLGHRQVPHVVKIGPQALIGKERTAFERIEHVLGNTAPRITDFAEHAGRGALKYRYASMGGSFSTTFQKLYAQGMPIDQISGILHTVFGELLGRLYSAATYETCQILEYYQFSPRWAGNVRNRVEALLGSPAEGDTLTLPGGSPPFPNPCLFYERRLPQLLASPRSDGCYQAYVHGDLNGANIVLDAHRNVWLIDFFHTHRGHVLRDLIKLENDLLYIFTPIEDTATLQEALRLSHLLLHVRDLRAPLPPLEETGLRHPALRRAWQVIQILRSFYPPLIQTDRDPTQLFVGQLRYAIHTLSFDECSPLQKQWALYTASLLAQEVDVRLRGHSRLRLDWLPEAETGPGRLGLTLLPGRRDYHRSLTADIAVLGAEGVNKVVCLLTENEFEEYGVEGLLAAYRAANLEVVHVPMRDQGVCSRSEMQTLVESLQQDMALGKRVLVHCVGGLGRSGTVAACYLRNRHGYSAEEALALVRQVRSPRAVESTVQEAFVASFTPMQKGPPEGEPVNVNTVSH
jgi:protein-tyrosine phosphatase